MALITQLNDERWIDLRTEEGRDEPGGSRTKVLVTIDSARHASTLIRTAAALARTSHSEILAVHVTWVPPQLPLSAAGQFETETRRVVQAMQRLREHVLDVPIRIALTAARRTGDVIVAASRRDDVPIAVVPWQPSLRSPSACATIDVNHVMRRALCRIVALRLGRPIAVPGRIVVAIRPNNRSVHTITAAAALARQHGASVRLLSLLPEGVDRRTEIDTRMWLVRVEGEFAEAGIPQDRVQRAVMTGGDLKPALEHHTKADDLIVLGVPTGLGPISRLRGRRLTRRFEDLDRPVALCRPQPPPSPLQRLKRAVGGN